MKRTAYSYLAAIALGAAALYFAWPALTARAQEPKEAPPAAAPPSPSIVAAGRVEPVSEEIKIGTELDGKLASVKVQEGDAVKSGQVLAVLVNDDFSARVRLAEAAVAQARATIAEREAELERVTKGNRPQEKQEALAAVREAEAVVAQTEAERRRRAQLLERGAIARTEFDVADREYRVGQARLDAMRERASLVHEGFRSEDKKRAEAELNRARAELLSAEARLAESQATLAKTFIRSPIDGVVLRKKMKAGESVSADNGQPIVTLGDLARLRVRADVDETDVARLRLGQQAYVKAAAYGDRRFTGRVVQIGEILGRKNVRTDEPTERVDTKILETLIELDPGQSLPVGLRVDAFLEKGGEIEP